MENNVIRYKELLMEENTKQNLISRKSTMEDVDLHIKDCIYPQNKIDFSNKTVIDIGSGAGMPGMIIALKNAEGEFTLLEADLKKSKFLEKTAEVLGLGNVTVIRRRAEDIGKDPLYREQYDFVTMRAVAEMNIALEYGLPLLKKGGRMLLWKGPRYKEEITHAQKAMDILGGEVNSIIPYVLDDGKPRIIIVIKKVGDTPEKYPRRTGIPVKRPL